MGNLGSVFIFKNGSWKKQKAFQYKKDGWVKISDTELPATPSLVYTLSNDGSYYIVGTGFDNLQAIKDDTTGGTVGNGLDSTWQGGDLVIPSAYNNKPVKAIAPGAFSEILNIDNIIMYDGMEVIGNSCFKCSSTEDTRLQTCILSDTIRFLGGEKGEVFWGRTQLSEVQIPKNVETLGINLFKNCKKFKVLTIPEQIKLVCANIGSGIFDLETVNVYCKNATFKQNAMWYFPRLKKTNTKSISDYFSNIFEKPSASPVNASHNLYLNDKPITDLIINNVENISSNACYANKMLKTIKIDDTVKTIGRGAFGDTTNVTSIEVGSGITELGQYCFSSNTTNPLSFTILAKTPPVYNESLQKSNYNITIYVPDESLSAYRSASGWSDFGWGKFKPISEKPTV